MVTVKSDRWTFPMMIIMAGGGETEAFMRFRDASLVTLRVAAFPATPMSVVAAAEKAISEVAASQLIDQWCAENADPGAVEFQIVKYVDDICEAWSPAPAGRPMGATASGSWFEKTMPFALPISGPEVVFKIKNLREDSRVVHLIAGLVSL